mmetsp:Transcript_32944/g.101775  ORF Transcript_32944/g.101775 Transcript_32944/m.101775 type:complete len:346 (+) Transcript_32944:727-1764(+)
MVQRGQRFSHELADLFRGVQLPLQRPRVLWRDASPATLQDAARDRSSGPVDSDAVPDHCVLQRDALRIKGADEEGRHFAELCRFVHAHDGRPNWPVHPLRVCVPDHLHCGTPRNEQHLVQPWQHVTLDIRRRSVRLGRSGVRAGLGRAVSVASLQHCWGALRNRDCCNYPQPAVPAHCAGSWNRSRSGARRVRGGPTPGWQQLVACVEPRANKLDAQQHVGAGEPLRVVGASPPVVGQPRPRPPDVHDVPWALSCRLRPRDVDCVVFHQHLPHDPWRRRRRRRPPGANASERHEGSKRHEGPSVGHEPFLGSSSPRCPPPLMPKRMPGTPGNHSPFSRKPRVPWI